MDLDQGDGDEGDDIFHLQRKIHHKCYRARIVLQDAAQRRRILLLNWAGAPLEALMSALQVLDSNKRALLDLHKSRVTTLIRSFAAGNVLRRCCGEAGKEH